MNGTTWLIKDCNAFLPGAGFSPRTGILVRGAPADAAALRESHSYRDL